VSPSDNAKARLQAETVITTHVNPDYDAVASMVAALKLYPGAVMLFPGGQNRNFRNFFVQSLLYLCDVVRPRDLDFASVRRLVVVDTRQASRLGAAAPALNNPGLDVHLYDHHPDGPDDLRGSFEAVESVGANVTLMTERILAQELPVSPQEATMLALGLYEDTGAFTFGSTTPRDLRAAAVLLELGADLPVVAELTSRELSAEQFSLLHELVLAAETRDIRGRTVVISMARRETHVEDVAVLAHKIMDMLGADLLFVMVQMENMVQVVARSRLRDVDVGRVALALGGGGHSSAAAACVRGRGLEEVRADLEKILAETWGGLYRAGSLMAHPPIAIGADRPVKEAMDTLVRFSLNVLLAVDDEGRTVGIVGEHAVAKANHHGLADYPVRDVMTTEFETAAPEASFAEVKRVIIDQGQRLLPVIEPDGRALGVITRTDLLRLMAGEAGPDRDRPREKGGGPYERNLLGLMEARLPAETLALLREVGDLARAAQAPLYLVGGSVRDLIMNKPVRDLDLALAGDMTGLLTALAERFEGCKIKSHPRFKTATVTLGHGARLDFSCARVEYYEHPGALPVVSQASIQLDLQRRDFSINALAVSLNSEDFGAMLDYYRGYQDLREGFIRVLHSLSLVEDPTRAFRAARFAVRLGFKISKMTLGLIESALKRGFFQNLHPRRIMTELRLACQEEEAPLVLERLAELGLLRCVHPDLKMEPSNRELLRKAAKIREWFHLTFSERSAPFWLVFFLALVDNLDQKKALKLAAQFDVSRKAAMALVEERRRLGWIFSRYGRRRPGPELRPSEVDRLFAPVSRPGVLYLMSKASGESLSRAGAAYLAVYRRVRPASTGADLLSLGLPSGPGVQKILDALRAARLDGEVESLEEEKELVRRRFLGRPEADWRLWRSEAEETQGLNGAAKGQAKFYEA
jgi:tRNA nucleotidyltransferase (CCA-adding enzyme)